MKLFIFLEDNSSEGLGGFTPEVKICKFSTLLCCITPSIELSSISKLDSPLY